MKTNKTEYGLIAKQLEALTDTEHHPLPNLSNVSALIYTSMADINWAGFYLMERDSLMLGPFQGKPACIRIPLGKGVCGTAVEQDCIQLVDDVHQFPGHIACDCDSKSEIVVPIHYDGHVIGVLDIDSPVTNRFTWEDAEGLQNLVHILEKNCIWTWKIC